MKTKGTKVLMLLVMSFFVLHSNAQNPRKLEATIKSTVECNFCKKNVEDKLCKMKGIRKVNADPTTHEIKVVYNSKRITMDEIKKAITDLGYDADDMKANNKMSTILKHKQAQEGK